MVKIELKKEFPNPVNLQKRLTLERKIKSIYITNDQIIVELEGEEEATKEEKEAIQTYFENNPYWKVIE